MIVKVDKENIFEAAKIHSISWKESHRSFCSEEFIEKHDIDHQFTYIEMEMNKGAIFYILYDEGAKGIISINEDLIENLYILPEEQKKGYGSKLLNYIISISNPRLKLWILSNNIGAYNLYSKNGFEKTGNTHKLNDTLYELEMILEK